MAVCIFIVWSRVAHFMWHSLSLVDDDGLVFYIPFYIIYAIFRLWKGNNERLCVKKHHIAMSWIPPPAGFKFGHDLKSGALTTQQCGHFWAAQKLYIKIMQSLIRQQIYTGQSRFESSAYTIRDIFASCSSIIPCVCTNPNIYKCSYRSDAFLDKNLYFAYFSKKTCTHLNLFAEVILMSSHNVCFFLEK